ncbi:MAG TPA: PIN domain-containing protein [Candidatus Nanoarchaeia archaeon]|nr:PIN domain-containing protein [Candidatus Nanoarchaeia archaeon]
MTDSELFDSTIWLEYFIKGSFKEKIEQDEVFSISSFSLFEIKRKLLKKKELKKKEIEEKMKFIKDKSLIINVDETIAEKAAEIAEEKSLGAADALIYTTALLNNATLLTLDNDFRGFDKVIVL